MTPSDPLAVLRDTFGFQDFRPGQREVVDAVLAGRDCIAVMPTGAGKSLTFQLPARILDGTVLVLSPLISLMKDQVDALRSLGFRAAEINSTLSFDERQRRLSAFRRGEFELVYLAPEALDARYVTSSMVVRSRCWSSMRHTASANGGMTSVRSIVS